LGFGLEVFLRFSQRPSKMLDSLGTRIYFEKPPRGVTNSHVTYPPNEEVSDQLFTNFTLCDIYFPDMVILKYRIAANCCSFPLHPFYSVKSLFSHIKMLGHSAKVCK